jgi:hypothetical protein
MRRSGGNRLFAFAPANDLSLISRSSDHGEGSLSRSRGGESLREVDLQGGKVLGDEWAEHVVENRNGIMLRASYVQPPLLGEIDADHVGLFW